MKETREVYKDVFRITTPEELIFYVIGDHPEEALGLFRKSSNDAIVSKVELIKRDVLVEVKEKTNEQ